MSNVVSEHTKPPHQKDGNVVQSDLEQPLHVFEQNSKHDSLRGFLPPHLLAPKAYSMVGKDDLKVSQRELLLDLLPFDFVPNPPSQSPDIERQRILDEVSLIVSTDDRETTCFHKAEVPPPIMSPRTPPRPGRKPVRRASMSNL